MKARGALNITLKADEALDTVERTEGILGDCEPIEQANAGGFPAFIEANIDPKDALDGVLLREGKPPETCRSEPSRTACS